MGGWKNIPTEEVTSEWRKVLTHPDLRDIISRENLEMLSDPVFARAQVVAGRNIIFTFPDGTEVHVHQKQWKNTMHITDVLRPTTTRGEKRKSSYDYGDDIGASKFQKVTKDTELKQMLTDTGFLFRGVSFQTTIESGLERWVFPQELLGRWMDQGFIYQESMTFINNVEDSIPTPVGFLLDPMNANIRLHLMAPKQLSYDEVARLYPIADPKFDNVCIGEQGKIEAQRAFSIALNRRDVSHLNRCYQQLIKGLDDTNPLRRLKVGYFDGAPVEILKENYAKTKLLQAKSEVAKMETRSHAQDLKRLWNDVIVSAPISVISGVIMWSSNQHFPPLDHPDLEDGKDADYWFEEACKKLQFYNPDAKCYRVKDGGEIFEITYPSPDENPVLKSEITGEIKGDTDEQSSAPEPAPPAAADPPAVEPPVVDPPTVDPPATEPLAPEPPAPEPPILALTKNSISAASEPATPPRGSKAVVPAASSSSEAGPSSSAPIITPPHESEIVELARPAVVPVPMVSPAEPEGGRKIKKEAPKAPNVDANRRHETASSLNLRRTGFRERFAIPEVGTPQQVISAPGEVALQPISAEGRQEDVSPTPLLEDAEAQRFGAISPTPLFDIPKPRSRVDSPPPVDEVVRPPRINAISPTPLLDSLRGPVDQTDDAQAPLPLFAPRPQRQFSPRTSGSSEESPLVRPKSPSSETEPPVITSVHRSPRINPIQSPAASAPKSPPVLPLVDRIDSGTASRLRDREYEPREGSSSPWQDEGSPRSRRMRTPPATGSDLALHMDSAAIIDSEHPRPDSPKALEEANETGGTSLMDAVSPMSEGGPMDAPSIMGEASAMSESNTVDEASGMSESNTVEEGSTITEPNIMGDASAIVDEGSTISEPNVMSEASPLVEPSQMAEPTSPRAEPNPIVEPSPMAELSPEASDPAMAQMAEPTSPRAEPNPIDEPSPMAELSPEASDPAMSQPEPVNIPAPALEEMEPSTPAVASPPKAKSKRARKKKQAAAKELVEGLSDLAGSGGSPEMGRPSEMAVPNEMAALSELAGSGDMSGLPESLSDLPEVPGPKVGGLPESLSDLPEVPGEDDDMEDNLDNRMESDDPRVESSLPLTSNLWNYLFYFTFISVFLFLLSTFVSKKTLFWHLLKQNASKSTILLAEDEV